LEGLLSADFRDVAAVVARELLITSTVDRSLETAMLSSCVTIWKNRIVLAVRALESTHPLSKTSQGLVLTSVL